MTRHVSRLLAAGAAAALALPALAAEPVVSPQALSAMMAGGDVAVIDIRGPFGKSGPEEFAAGHIPGSVHETFAVESAWMTKVDGVVGMLPAATSVEAAIQALGVDQGEQVVIVSSGKAGAALSPAAAARVYWTFKMMGHDAVSILDGGYAAWEAAGLPVTTEAAAPAMGDFMADVQPQYLATMSDVADSMSTPVALLDARGPAMFTGETVSDKVTRGGAIPGAVNTPFAAMLNADKSGYADAATVRAALAKAGVDLNGEAIVYCNIGLSGAAGWFAASEVAGMDATLYDGSAAEWTIEPHRPTLITAPGS